jgi:hypothetical protein
MWAETSQRLSKWWVDWAISKKGLLTNRRSVRRDISTTVLFLKDVLGVRVLVLMLVLMLVLVLVLVLVLETIRGTVPGLLLLLWIEGRHLQIINSADIEAGWSTGPGASPASWYIWAPSLLLKSLKQTRCKASA